jgi:hypothetical protein
MARNPDDVEENSGQRDDDQAQDIGEEAVSRRFDGAGELDRDPTVDTEHGGTANPAAILPEDAQDLVDTMNQMITSGIIDNGAFASEPKMDDEEDLIGQTEEDD